MNKQLYVKDGDDKFIPYEDAKYTFYDDSFCYIVEGKQDFAWFVKISDIVLFESVGNYTIAKFYHLRPLFLSSLNQVEERLVKCSFFRANRKQLINIRKIEKIEPYYNGGILIYMSNNACIEVSRRKYILFKKMVGIK